MASAAVMSAVKTQLTSAWSGLCASASVSPAPPIIYPNLPGLVPDDGSPFLAVEYPVASEAMKSQGAPGSNIWREEGAFVLTLCVGVGADLLTSGYATLVDLLRSNLRGQTLAAGSGRLQLFEASPAVFRDSSDRGAYCELSASVAYWFDVIG